MDPADALARLAEASGLKLKKVGANSYLLLAANPSPPKRAAQPKPIVKVPDVEPAPAENEGEEVIVVASKRDTTSLRFAGQWLKIAGDEFAPLGVPGTEAIEARSVGFSSTHLGAGRNKLFIRGIADSSFSGPTQSPVGQYFGDMRTTYSGPDPDLKLVDMQSVEILEGPQGTLYGSGALGGIVLLKPNMPSFDRMSGLVAAGTTATWHGDAGYDLSGVLNAPLGSAAALRAVGYWSREGGYVDNRATGEDDVNDVDIRGARATLTAELAPDWFVDVSGVGQRIDGDDSQYADMDGGLSRSSLVDQPFSSDFTLASLVIRKDRGAIRFRSTTGASWQNVDENFDASANGETRQLRQRSKARALSNETRLWRPMSEGYSWLIGFSSIRHRYGVDREVETPGGRFDLAGVENEVGETTVYGEAGVELRKGLEASLGARFTHSELSGSGEHLSPLVLARLDDDDAERNENRFLPSASLLARPVEGLTLYARYQQGFRPGGLSIAGDTVRLYRNDRLGTAEAGFRYGRPGIDRFDLQGGATLSQWKDIQADFLDASGLPVTDNIGDGRVWTVTTNGGFRLTPELRLEAGLAWNDGRITKPTDAFRAMFASAAADSSMEIPNIARFVARGAVDWRTSLTTDWTLEANAYARFVGKSRLGIGPHLGESQGEYVDSGLVVRVAGDKRAISLSVTNLTDETGNRFAFGAPIATGVDQITPLRPRTIRLGFEQGF
jgi:outer membrane receptor protein involved in Fe transport